MVSLAVTIMAFPAVLTAIDDAVGAVLSILIVPATAVERLLSESTAYKLYSPSLSALKVSVVLEFAAEIETEFLFAAAAPVMLAKFVTVTD